MPLRVGAHLKIPEFVFHSVIKFLWILLAF